MHPEDDQNVYHAHASSAKLSNQRLLPTMTIVAPDATSRPMNKHCTLRTHDPSFSQEEILFNLDRFEELRLKPGDLAQIIPVRQGVHVRDFVKPRNESESILAAFNTNTSFVDGSLSVPATDLENWRAYTFVAKETPKEIREKDLSLRVRVSVFFRP